MTPDELIDRVRNCVNGVEMDAGPRDAALALLRAGMTVVGIALRRLDDDEREYQLQKLEKNTREYFANVAAATERWRLRVN
jgi:hypothetical protein